jgi:hypothetical protein
MSKGIKQPKLSAGDRLARLKTSVQHVGDAWALVLHRRTYMQSMGRREDLRDALNHTHAAHVHNTLRDVLLLDLIREIGALVLDRTESSSSVATAVDELRDGEVLTELEAEYRVASPVAPRFFKDDAIDPETRAQITASIHATQLQSNLEELSTLPDWVAEIDRSVLKTPVAELIRTLRNKGVAHYDVIQDGTDWKMWRERGTGLTYGQLSEYIDLCTVVIDRFSHLIRRLAFDFEGTIRVAQGYADDYLGALVIGLQHKRREEEERRARMQIELDALQKVAGPSRE